MPVFETLALIGIAKGIAGKAVVTGVGHTLTAGGIHAGAGVHSAAVAAAHDSAALTVAHMPTVVVAHGSLAYAGTVTGGAVAASSATGSAMAAIAAIGAGAFTYYQFMSKVAEYRKKIGKDKDSFFDKKGSLYDLAGTGTPKWGSVDIILISVFKKLDEAVEQAGHRNIKGELKKSVDEIEECMKCGCDDLDLASDGRSCTQCSCAPVDHRTLTFEEHYLMDGPGLRALKVLAEEFYASLLRFEGDDATSIKKYVHQIRCCQDCGCTDYIANRFGGTRPAKACFCRHEKSAHTLQPFLPGKEMRRFYVYLSIMADYLYQQEGHKTVFEHKGEVWTTLKRSILQLQPSPTGSCQDFTYGRNSSWSNNDHRRAKCVCGVAYKDHGSDVSWFLECQNNPGKIFGRS